MSIEVLGIDIAKNVFQLHGVNQNDNVVLKRRVMRDQLLEVLAQINRCTVETTTIKILGIDIAKNVFQLHGLNSTGRVFLKRRSASQPCDTSRALHDRGRSMYRRVLLDARV